MKRLFSICLCLTLIFSTAVAKPKKLTQTLKWDVTPEGTLVISGSGDMPDWAVPQNEAWYKEGKWHKINKIVIEEGVTSIGFKSFSPIGEKFVRSMPVELVLPSTLAQIGDFSFKGTPIKELKLPEGVRRIGLGSFSGSLKQDSLVFPSTLKAIADGAFMRSKVNKVVFNSDVLVEQGAFFECPPLTTVDFSDTWTELASAAFEGNHKLLTLERAGNLRTPNGNPFIRTPLERSPEVLALLGLSNPNMAANNKKNDDQEEVSTSDFISEVDFNIPMMDGIDRERTFALVIGNEKYTREADVPYANKDAEVFSLYLKKALGIPSKNVQLIKDASLNDMRFGLNLLAKTSNAFEGDVNLIIYYAGHGVPDEATRDAYLLPVDGYGADTSTGYSLEKSLSASCQHPLKEHSRIHGCMFQRSQA